MTDLETQLYDTLHALPDAGRSMYGPALRRKARTRQLGVRGGSLVALGAAGTAAALVGPGLLASSPSTGTGAVGTPSTKASGPAPAPASSPVLVKVASPVPSTPAPSSTPASVVTPVSVPAKAQVWAPAGVLIDNPTVLATAPKVAATDSEWPSWTKDWKEGPLLLEDTVTVVYAGAASIHNSGSDDSRPLVIVTGRSSAHGPLQIAVLTSAAGDVDAMKLDTLTLEAMTPADADTDQAIAVQNGMTMYVAAQAGVDSATYTWTDDAGTHTAPMTVTNGIAVAPEPMLALKSSANGKITNIKAFSHGSVVWDAAPVAGR